MKMTRKQRRTFQKIIAAAIFTVCGIFVGILGDGMISDILMYIALTAAYLLVGLEVLIRAVRGVIGGQLLDENFLMAIATIGAILLGVSAGVFGTANTAPVTFFVMFIQLNLALMIFNLMPIPPLDGSRLMFYATKMKEETYYKIAANAWWILLALILLPSPGNSFLSYVFRPIFEASFDPLLHFADWIARCFAAGNA